MQKKKLKWKVNEKDVLNDIKYFMKEYCLCSAVFNGKRVQLNYENGQKFIVEVEKIT